MLMQRTEPLPPERFVPPVRKSGAWSMTARACTALVGGYAASAAVATLLARLLPVARVEATTWGLIAAFLLYTTIGLWCFREPRLARVAAVVWGIALVGGGTAYLLGIRS